MRVVIAGGHGKIALALEKMLADRGDSVAGLIRNADQSEDLRSAGAEAIVVDLENSSVDELAALLQNADAVVFAAGAGPGSGIERKTTVDRDAAILLADAAEAAGVGRYLMVSAMGADSQPADNTGDPVFAAYLTAKAAADEAVRGRPALNATIVRPGALTDDAGTGRVRVAASTGRGSIPRADVAAMLVALLDAPSTSGVTFELISGDASIEEAMSVLSG
ncbi:NAD-dependent dehydratase [Mycobacterium antarcticum]|uniref:NAD(P)H-binding protein n=1 Tax=unclassified Mycolicibacterium TaxID=2636767 RepID=UPI00239D91AF|nr:MULTISPECIES: NAD(P)H-binding protein [unclassified Mycolicibacterium]BDX32768.1 NAD-dependent dehydratase [Mycolicibacterium sp. TUM20985]GLP75973.1 NAD-dependent dehydratase [Mycolicibacterium sp. TUM20983]GLP83681.1 NAD-dependent dehydratase [Mycolicibacterium sp. TUM20984]